MKELSRELKSLIAFGMEDQENSFYLDLRSMTLIKNPEKILPENMEKIPEWKPADGIADHRVEILHRFQPVGQRGVCSLYRIQQHERTYTGTGQSAEQSDILSISSSELLRVSKNR